MDAEQLTASWAAPPLLFVSYEMSYANFFYLHKVVDHTHAILHSIALIQMLQPVAGESAATEAIPGFPFPDILTVLDPAGKAGLRFVAVF